MDIAYATAAMPILRRGFFSPSLSAVSASHGVEVLPERRGLPVLQALSLQVFREGEATPDVKRATLFAGDEPDPARAIGYFALGAVPVMQLFRTELLRDQFLVQITDNGVPRLGLMRWPVLDASTRLLSYNLTEGQGGGVITQPAKIPSLARVDGIQRVRKVVVVEEQADGQWRVAGAGATRPDGWQDVDLDVTASGTRYALGLDDFGTLFEPGKAVTIGQRVRPTRFAGWLYEVTEAGNLPSVEPEWWPIQGENPSRQLGTARAIAVRYYVPLALGPVPVEMN